MTQFEFIDDSTFEFIDDSEFEFIGSIARGYILKEDGTGDFTSLVTALADPGIVDGCTFEAQGPWENPDAGIYGGSPVIVYNDNTTVTASGEARYPGYTVENPTYWRGITDGTAYRNFTNDNAVGTVLDGLYLENNNDTETPQACIRNQGGTITVDSSCLSKISGSGGVVGVTMAPVADGSIVNLVNTQIFGCTLRAISIGASLTAGLSTEVNINSCSIVKNGYGVYMTGAGTLNLNIFNSVIAGSTTADIHEADGEIVLNAHNSIDSDGSLEAYDDGAYGCLSAVAITDSDDPPLAGSLVFKSITAPPYDLRSRALPQNCAYEMHSDGSGAGLTIPVTDISGNPRTAPYTCGANEAGYILISMLSSVDIDTMIAKLNIDSNANIDSFLTGIQSKSVDFNGLVIESQSKLVEFVSFLDSAMHTNTELDGLSTKSLVKNNSLNSLLIDAKMQGVDLEGFLIEPKNKNVNFSSFLDRSETVNIDLDGFLTKSPAQSVDIDAAVRLTTIGVLPTRAVIQAVQSADIPIDALITMVLENALDVDTLLTTSSVSMTLTEGLIAYLSKILGADLHSFIQKSLSCYSIVDGQVFDINNVPVNIGGLALSVLAVACDYDATISNNESSNAEFNSMVLGEIFKIIDYDALIKDSQDQITDIDGLFFHSDYTQAAVFSAMKQIVSNEAIGMNSIIESIGIVSDAVIDSLLILAHKAVTSSVHSLVMAAKAGVVSLDALIGQFYYEHASFNSIVQAINSRSISLDSLLENGNIKNVDIDDLIQKIDLENIGFNSLMMTIQNCQSLIGALIHQADITKNTGINVVISRIVEETQQGVSFDAKPYMTAFLYFNVDAPILDTFYKSSNFGSVIAMRDVEPVSMINSQPNNNIMTV